MIQGPRKFSSQQVVSTARQYVRQHLRQDALAGLTTAVMLIPQGMAYAMLAGLPPIVGLYAATVPPLMYALLGTSRQLSVGPVAMDSLLVAAGVGAIAEAGSDQYIAYAVLLALMTGVIQLGMGMLRAGFVVNFLSHPVISGFTSAAALIIGLSQLSHLLGISLDKSQSVFGLLAEATRRSGEVVWPTLGIGLGSVVILLGLKRLKPTLPRALVVVVVGALVVFATGWSETVAIVGTVPAGLPAPRLPEVSWEPIRQLLPTAVAISLVAFMESISVSQAYARKNRYSIDANRELVAIGAANVAGAFFQGYPVTGGFSRTAVNAQAGAQTKLAGLITSITIALALLFLTPAFYFLPKAALAAIIVTAVFGLVDYREVVHLYRVKRSDLALLLVTFVATLSLGIVEGISVGVGASLLWFVVRTTRPHIAELGRIPGTRLYRNVKRQEGLVVPPGVLAVRMDAQFYFGNISFLRKSLGDLEAARADTVRAVVLDASAMNNLDSSAETALRQLHEDYESRGILFYISCIKGPVKDVLDRSGFSSTLGKRGHFRAVQDAIDHALSELDDESSKRPGGEPSSQPKAAGPPPAIDGPAARIDSLREGYSYVI